MGVRMVVRQTDRVCFLCDLSRKGARLCLRHLTARIRRGQQLREVNSPATKAEARAHSVSRSAL